MLGNVGGLKELCYWIKKGVEEYGVQRSFFWVCLGIVKALRDIEHAERQTCTVNGGKGRLQLEVQGTGEIATRCKNYDGETGRQVKKATLVGQPGSSEVSIEISDFHFRILPRSSHSIIVKYLLGHNSAYIHVRDAAVTFKAAGLISSEQRISIPAECASTTTHDGRDTDCGVEELLRLLTHTVMRSVYNEPLLLAS